MKIPIHNLYYLLAYAWNRLEESGLIDVGAIEANTYLELFSRVLCKGTSLLLKQGLVREYITCDEEIRGIKGRIDFQQTYARNLLANGKMQCRFDEMSHDAVPNQIIKATLRRLLRVDDIDRSVKDEVAGLYRKLGGISDVELRSALLQQARTPRHQPIYGLLLDVCRLLYDGLLPQEHDDGFTFRDFTRNDKAMALLFESFVREFYRREQSHFRVSAKSIPWQDTEASAANLSLLPKLNTDVTLSSAERSIVMDTKFYGETLMENYGKKMVRSEHLNQIFAYVVNVGVAEKKPNHQVEGLLLYPVVQEDFELDYSLHGYRVRVLTVDLSLPWATIHERLCDCIQ